MGKGVVRSGEAKELSRSKVWRSGLFASSCRLREDGECGSGGTLAGGTSSESQNSSSKPSSSSPTISLPASEERERGGWVRWLDVA